MMKHLIKYTLLLLLVASLLFNLAGCGSQKSKTVVSGSQATVTDLKCTNGKTGTFSFNGVVAPGGTKALTAGKGSFKVDSYGNVSGTLTWTASFGSSPANTGFTGKCNSVGEITYMNVSNVGTYYFK
jgi:hypothetical protein